jgi:hypothetical protein
MIPMNPIYQFLRRSLSAHWIPCLVWLCLPAVTESFAAEKTKTCFQCNGTGKWTCQAPGCKNGQIECPGPCLRLSKGDWHHMDVEGHSPNDVWITFRKASGGTRSWNQNHVGEVIEMQNGEPQNIGKCQICGGKTRVKCAVCQGVGIVTCGICEGKKVVPLSWTAFDNPKMKSRPTRFRLKDGRVLVGRKVIVMGSRITIRTEKGEVEVNSADVLPEEKGPAQK